MSLAPTNLTSGIANSPGASTATASITCVIGRLYVLAVSNRVVAGTANTPTVTGAGQTWAQIATNTSGDGQRRITLFRCLPSVGGSGALTIDCAGQSQGSMGWSVEEWTGHNTSGTNGSGAIVQSVAGDQETNPNTGLTMVLAALGSANNAAYGFFRQGVNQALTPGLTQLSQVNDAASNSSVLAEWATNQISVGATWTSTSNITVGAAIEIAAAAPTKTATVTVLDENLAPLANLSNLTWYWEDVEGGGVIASGSAESTNANAVLQLDLSASALTSGQSGYLRIHNSDFSREGYWKVPLD